MFIRAHIRQFSHLTIDFIACDSPSWSDILTYLPLGCLIL
jgi:hypothetical protein